MNSAGTLQIASWARAAAFLSADARIPECIVHEIENSRLDNAIPPYFATFQPQYHIVTQRVPVAVSLQEQLSLKL